MTKGTLATSGEMVKVKHVKVQEIIQWSKSRPRLFLPLSKFNRTGRSVIVLCRALLKAIATPVDKK